MRIDAEPASGEFGPMVTGTIVVEAALIVFLLAIETVDAKTGGVTRIKVVVFDPVFTVR